MAGESSGSCEIGGMMIDRISTLPDEVREYILGFLQISDAVRTSVLSRKWRVTWTKTVQLNLYFDEAFENKVLENDNEKDTINNRYFGLVSRILLSHDGPIHKCVLQPIWHDVEGDMNAWMQLLARKGIKDLTIHCVDYIDEFFFDLPPSVFNCLELSHLTLGKCSLRKSISFKGFPNLVRLNLSYVSIFGDMLTKIVSNCPLEMLFIEHCVFYTSKTNHSGCINAISAPNLRVLDIGFCYDGLCWSYVKYTPNLRVASFWNSGTAKGEDEAQANCFHILKSLPKIEMLTFDCTLHKTSASDIILKRLPGSLVNLKTVNLRYRDPLSLDQEIFMFCIIRSSPNLQNLNIHMSDGDYSFKAAEAYLVVEDEEEIKTSITTMSVTLDRVGESVRFGAEISLVSRIVSCSPALGQLVIKRSSLFKASTKLQLSRAFKRFGKLKVIYLSGY